MNNKCIQSDHCHACKGDLIYFNDFQNLPQVTSDCRPWKAGGDLAICKVCLLTQKPTNERWAIEAQEIYGKYALYAQGGGAEQPIFNSDAGTYTARSNVLVQWLSNTTKLKEHGSLLDIGCGTGAFLKAFASSNIHWVLSGFEQDDKNLTVIESISGVKKLYSGELETIDSQFDIVSLIHSLEHIPDPIHFLSKVKTKVVTGGSLIVEVPNVEQSPFDILIADHCSHFSPKTLKTCVLKAGFYCDTVEADISPKEISLLARSEKIHNKIVAPSFSEEELSKAIINTNSQIKWLNKLIEQGNSIQGKIGIFGTSISATWLYSCFPEKVSFFVDEDLGRVGGTHMNLNIYGIKDLPNNIPILVPLRSDLANSISNRLKLQQLVMPPE